MSPAWFTILCALAVSTAASIVQLDHAIFVRDTELTLLKNASLAFSKTNEELGHIRAGPIAINVTCNYCETFGTAQLSRSRLICDETIEDLIKSLSEDEADISNFLSSKLQIDFVDTSAIFDVNIEVSGRGSLGFNLITMPLVPLGDSFRLSGIAEATMGLILSLDLVFYFKGGAAVDTTFQVTIPSGASILIDTISGEILSFPGFEDSKLNVTNTSIGDFFSDFAVSLRATIMVGMDVGNNIPGFKKYAIAEAGVFIDLIKYEVKFTVADQHALTVGALPPTTTVVADVPLPTTKGTAGGPKAGCMTESLSIDLGGFLILTANARKAADHFQEPGSIDLFTYPLRQRCF